MLARKKNVVIKFKYFSVNCINGAKSCGQREAQL